MLELKLSIIIIYFLQSVYLTKNAASALDKAQETLQSKRL